MFHSDLELTSNPYPSKKRTRSQRIPICQWSSNLHHFQEKQRQNNKSLTNKQTKKMNYKYFFSKKNCYFSISLSSAANTLHRHKSKVPLITVTERASVEIYSSRIQLQELPRWSRDFSFCQFQRSCYIFAALLSVPKTIAKGSANSWKSGWASAIDGPASSRVEPPVARQQAAEQSESLSLSPTPGSYGLQTWDRLAGLHLSFFPLSARIYVQSVVKSERKGRLVLFDQDCHCPTVLAFSPRQPYSGLGFFSEEKKGTLKVYWV